MRKLFFTTLATLICFAACEKDVRVQDETTPIDETPVKEQVTITASIPEEGFATKVAFEEEDSGSGKMRLTKLLWEEGDQLTINGETFTVKTGTISLDGKTADFTGNDPGAGPYTITYSSLPGDINNQTQKADGDPDYLGYSVSLTGATTYTSFEFSDSGATALGATLTQSSVLQLRAVLPAAVASAVRKVIFTSSKADLFGSSNTLSVELETPGTVGSDNTLDIYAALPAGADVTLDANMDFLIQFQVSANAYDKYTAYRQFTSGTHFIIPGRNQYIGINCANIESYANKSNTNIGESTNPYLIGDQHQMQAIALSSTKQYYKLVDNIDMTNVSWTPWNKASGYNDCVYFNGNDKSISHLNYPLFYVLKASTVKNLTFKDATISITGRGGTLAQFIQGTGTEVTNVDVDNVSVTAEQYTGGLIGRINSGSGLVAATISNCDLTNTTVSSGGNTHAGGIVGSVEYATTITDCSFSGDVTATAKQYVGGIVGYITEGTISKCCYKSGTVSGDSYLGGLVGVKLGTTALSIDNCYVSGNVLGTGQRVGGILGDYDAAGTCTIENCYVSGSVKSDRCVGGIVGFVRATGLSLIRCMPYNSEIRATSESSNDYYSSGVVVGYSSADLVVNYCYRANIADASWPFSEYAKYFANNTVANHAFITSAGSITKRIDSWAYSYYHHGRKTSAANLSALVQMGSAIGESWSSDIWDFSGDYPTLK